MFGAGLDLTLQVDGPVTPLRTYTELVFLVTFPHGEMGALLGHNLTL